jgi:hypothetical protein
VRLLHLQPQAHIAEQFNYRFSQREEIRVHDGCGTESLWHFWCDGRMKSSKITVFNSKEIIIGR